MAISKAEAQVIEWIECRDYAALFTRMCCAHFALVSHKAGLGDIYCLQSLHHPRFLGHVFVINSLKGPFDVIGYRAISEMLTTLNWCVAPHLPCYEARVREEIDSIGLSAYTTSKIFYTAETLLKSILEQNE
jgi:hypothetical protein